MSVKLLICGRRRPGQSLSAHRHHMKNVHGAMVLDYIAADPDHAPRHYVQNHAFDGWFAAGDPSQNPLALARDFITEIGFPDMPSVKASRETEFYLTHLKPDEPRMVDDASVFGMPVRETVVAATRVGWTDQGLCDDAEGCGWRSFFKTLGRDGCAGRLRAESAPLSIARRWCQRRLQVSTSSGCQMRMPLSFCGRLPRPSDCWNGSRWPSCSPIQRLC